MAASKRRRREHEEEHENHERWLVSYADMITVLMALFIVLFAMSQVDEQKYQQLKDGLAVGFGREHSILTGSSPISNSKGTADPGSASYEMLVQSLPEDERTKITQVLQEADRLRNERSAGEAKVEVDRLLKVWRRIDRALRAQGLRDDVRATVDERGLVVSLVSENIVFEADVAELSDRGRRVVDVLAPVLARLSEPLELDGHTNQEKVQPKYFATDWELSLARAAHVLRRLEEVHHIPARRLRATGFGHTKPLVDPAVAGSQHLNKRVDVVVLSQAPAETRVLMSEAYAALLRAAGLDPVTDSPPATDADTDADTATDTATGTATDTATGTATGTATPTETEAELGAAEGSAAHQEDSP